MSQGLDAIGAGILRQGRGTLALLARIPSVFWVILLVWGLVFATLWQVRQHPGNKVLDYLAMLDQSSTETLQLIMSAVLHAEPHDPRLRFAIVTLGDGFDTLAPRAIAPKQDIAATLDALRRSGAQSVFLDVLIAVRGDPDRTWPTPAEAALTRALNTWANDPQAPPLLLAEAQRTLDPLPPDGFRIVETFLPMPAALQQVIDTAPNIHLVNTELVADADGVVRRFERVVTKLDAGTTRLQPTAAFTLHALAAGCPPLLLDRALNDPAPQAGPPDPCARLVALATDGTPQRLPIRYSIDASGGAVDLLSSDAVITAPQDLQGMDVILRASSFFLPDVYQTPQSTAPVTGSLVIANTALSDLMFPEPLALIWVAIPSLLGLCLIVGSNFAFGRLADTILVRLETGPQGSALSRLPIRLLGFLFNTGVRLATKAAALTVAVVFLGTLFWMLPELKGQPGLSLPSLGSLLAGLLVAADIDSKRTQT